mmetsp:Transcript_19281/g.26504  ORF Transcript_19281/g.26504 Transcript_19281/m.26504 type:complete len:91 (-) Transcript_19281:52-324(-)
MDAWLVTGSGTFKRQSSLRRIGFKMSSTNDHTLKGALCTDANGLLLSVSGDFDTDMRDITAGRFTSIIRTASKLSDSRSKNSSDYRNRRK